jgi:hypothetical protein
MMSTHNGEQRVEQQQGPAEPYLSEKERRSSFGDRCPQRLFSAPKRLP